MQLDFSDDVLANAVKNFISAMLPHEAYNSNFFTLNFNALTSVIHLDELDLEYEVLCQFLEQLSKIQIHVGAVPSKREGEESFGVRLEYEQLDLYLNASLDSFISNNTYKVVNWMASRGEKVDLTIPGDYEKSMNSLAEEVLDLYQECFDLHQDSSQTAVYSTVLISAVKDNAIEQACILGNKIRLEGARVGKVSYRGSDGWISFNNKFQTELTARLQDHDDSLVIINNPEAALMMRKRNEEQYKPIAPWGFDPLDDLTPISTNNYYVVVAQPNTGKTTWTCGTIANNVLEAGKKVCIISGESTTNIPYAMVLSNFIWRNYHVYVTENQILGSQPIEVEGARFKQMGEMALAENGGLILKKAIHYDNAYNDLVSIFQETHADVFILDHTLSMVVSPGVYYRSDKDKVDALSSAIVQFKNDFQVAVIALSHVSTDGQEEFRKTGRIVNSQPTKASSNPTADADGILFMYLTESLQSRNLIGIQCVKRRNATRFSPDVFLKPDFRTMSYDYIVEDQPASNREIQMEQALTNIATEIGSGYSSDLASTADHILED